MLHIEYRAAEVLASLEQALRYNGYLEQELAKFLDSETSVLDFGAGCGEFSRRMAARGVKVTCVDADARFRRRLRDEGFDARASLHELTSQSVSRIMTLNVLEHIEDDVGVMAEFFRVMRSDAKLFVYVPAFQCLYSHLDRAVDHVRRYEKRELVDKLSQAGFDVESVRYVDSVGFLAWGAAGLTRRLSDGNVKFYDRVVFPISRLVDRLTHRWFGKNLLAVARKPPSRDVTLRPSLPAAA